MIRLTNGSSYTRDYETIGLNTETLEIKTRAYKDHLKILSADTYRKYKLLKEDWDKRLIDQITYLEFLRHLKGFFDRNPESLHPHAPELNAEEILKAIEDAGV